MTQRNLVEYAISHVYGTFTLTTMGIEVKKGHVLGRGGVYYSAGPKGMAYSDVTDQSAIDAIEDVIAAMTSSGISSMLNTWGTLIVSTDNAPGTPSVGFRFDTSERVGITVRVDPVDFDDAADALASLSTVVDNIDPSVSAAQAEALDALVRKHYDSLVALCLAR